MSADPRPPHLTRQGEEALKCLVCLARASAPLRASELADRAGVSPAQAAKIMSSLRKGRFVASCRGRKGGFWLQAPPNQVYVFKVIDFFHEPDKGALREVEDAILRAWREEIRTGRDTFHELTLADLVAESRECKSQEGFRDRREV